MNQHSKAIREVAKQWEAKGKRYKDDDEMSRAYFADARDLVMVARLLDHGKRKTAYEVACCFDTVVRDLIPNTTWNYLEAV